ncbi:hypothetical protein [Mycobacterium malmoense]|uniref:hypothetical protein n=1 Tax=Mycobacterium malmoense TaxID=1780 RepID=UPI001146A822|nr:hypothetical protein [Mycobacterium malmoense]
MTDSHRCFSGRDCRDAETVEDAGRSVRRGAPIAEERGLCEACVRRVQYAIEDLPADYVALHVSLGEASTAAGMKVNSTPTPAIPIDAHKFAVMTAISENLDRAAEIVSEALNCDPPSGKTAPRLEKAARMVATNLPKLLAAGDVAQWIWERCDQRCGKNGCDAGEHLRLSDRNGIETALALREVHRRARGIIGELEKILRIERMCGECGAPRIYQDPVTNVVFCRDCSKDWTEEMLGLAGRMIKEKEREQQDMAINQELETRALNAEWCLAELQWKLTLAQEYPEVPAADFVRVILPENTKTVDQQGKIAS